MLVLPFPFPFPFPFRNYPLLSLSERAMCWCVPACGNVAYAMHYDDKTHHAHGAVGRVVLRG